MPSNDRPSARKVIGALRGNNAAAAELVEWSLPRLSSKVQEAYNEVEAKRESDWDAAEARAMAMNGEVPAAMTEGAFSEVQKALIRVLAYIPATLMADDDEMEAMNDLLMDAALDLVVMLHNPTIKYGIIGGFRPEVREDAEAFVERYHREIWGTLFALTSEEEVTAGDFPPETGDVIRVIGESRQRARGD